LAIKFSARALPVLVFAGTLAFSACKSERSRATVQNEEPKETAGLLSVVRMNDPAVQNQLLNGFYGIENSSWRWTAGGFSVLLRTPPGSAQRGASLDLALSIPDPVIRKLRQLKLTASTNGTVLNSAGYNAPGQYHFSADVPPAMLGADSTRIDFALDKTMQPDGDKRVLGIVADSVALTAK
jgi:hypothetical protein